MRIGPSEKLEIIWTVEEFEFSVRQTLHELVVLRSTFYQWLVVWTSGFGCKEAQTKRFWDKISDKVKALVVEKAKLGPHFLHVSWPSKSSMPRVFYLGIQRLSDF